MKKDKKLTKADWFDIRNYKKPSFIDPGNWAYQLRVRQLLLSEIKNFNEHGIEINSDLLDSFESIKAKGLVGLKWNFPDMTLKDLGIFDSKLNVDNSDNDAIQYAENLKQQQADKDFITNTVSVSTVMDLVNEVKSMAPSLKASYKRFNYMKSRIYQNLSESDIKDIKAACEIYPHHEIFNGMMSFQIDLTAPYEAIISDFNKVLRAIKSDKRMFPESTIRSSSIKVNGWNNTIISFLDSRILPYLDLLIYSKLNNKHLADNDAEEIIFGKSAADNYDKVKKTTKVQAFKLIKNDQIEAFWMLYMSKPSSFWKEKSIKYT